MRYPHLTSAAALAPAPGQRERGQALPPLVAVAHGSRDPRAAASTAELMRLAQEMAVVTFKEYGLQDANTLEATQIMLKSRVVTTFPLNDQEVLCRHLHKVTADWIADYQERIESFPVLSQATPGQVRAALLVEPPVHGEPFGELLRDLDQIILPGISDPETSDVLGKLIGRSEYTEQQVSVGADGRISRSYSTRHDAMATPDTLRQLRAGSGIVIHRGSPPALVGLPYWFQKRRYRRFAKVPYFRAAEHVRR